MLKFTPERFAQHIDALAKLQDNTKYALGERDIRVVSKGDEQAKESLKMWRALVLTGIPGDEITMNPMTLTQLKDRLAEEGEMLYSLHEKGIIDVAGNWTQLLRDRLPVTPQHFGRLEAYRKVEGLLNRF